ncbi:MAG: hypothetical protein R2749_21130 [Acidimicrobiales bacterium]
MMMALTIAHNVSTEPVTTAVAVFHVAVRAPANRSLKTLRRRCATARWPPVR